MDKKRGKAITASPKVKQFDYTALLLFIGQVDEFNKKLQQADGLIEPNKFLNQDIDAFLLGYYPKAKPLMNDYDPATNKSSDPNFAKRLKNAGWDTYIFPYIAEAAQKLDKMADIRAEKTKTLQKEDKPTPPPIDRSTKSKSPPPIDRSKKSKL